MADEKKLTKAELYRRIAESSADEVILSEMIRLGFWPDGEELPDELADLLRRQAELQRRAAELRAKHATVSDPEAALAEERKRRMEESKRRREERRKEREAERARRREAWAARVQAGAEFLGEGVSGGLSDTGCDASKLALAGLPQVGTAAELAEAIGIELKKLRWLTYHRRAATVCHYIRFTIPKRSGGERAISSPRPLLRRAQSWVKEQILDRLGVSDEAHGFVRERSIVSNAGPHAGHDVVINVDLKDFFPTFTFKRVKGFFRKVGYGEAIATMLALLCTEPPRVATRVGDKLYHVALGDRVLPQGACTSPALTNLMCRRLDRRLAGLARKSGLAFTRYADDITFSGDGAVPIPKILGGLRRIVEDEGLAVHPDKTRVLRKGRRQEVTGLVVNERVGVSRAVRRRLRAIIHNVRKNGLASQNRAGHRDFAAHLRGVVSFVQMVDADAGRRLREDLEKALQGG